GSIIDWISAVACSSGTSRGGATLIKAIAGLLPVQSGDIRIFGRGVGQCHHRVCYLAQRSEIDWRFPMDVHRLVMTGRYVHLGWLRHPRKIDEQIVMHTLDQLGIADLARRQIGELSGGQQQRALLARALVQQADLLLFDEPLNAVDVDTRHVFQLVLDQLRLEGKTIVIATHDHGRLDEQYDQVEYLHEGRQWRVNSSDGPDAHGHSHPTSSCRSCS
ncbi:MAG: ATP-binding cassette domain-containing protein, partial [Phycisphaeraceae bacterium]|nr:ATP-binding cassette domain-containing protein [Phycisphaeraceae bacterium]